MSDPKKDPLHRMMDAVMVGFNEVARTIAENKADADATKVEVAQLKEDVAKANRNAEEARQTAAQANDLTRRVFRNLDQPARAKMVHDMSKEEPVPQVATKLGIAESTAYRHKAQHKKRTGK